MDAWMHAVSSLIVWGRPYFDLHQQMDLASQTLGWEWHRLLGHDYYQAFDNLWNWDNLFPDDVLKYLEQLKEKCGDDAQEEETVKFQHCIEDRIWDDKSPQDKEYLRQALKAILLAPDLLKDKYRIDVLAGKMLYRMGDEDVWVKHYGLEEEYQRLVNYVLSF